MALTVTGSGSVTSGPSRRTRHSSSATTAAPSTHSPGKIQRGSRVEQGDAVAADQVGGVGDVPDEAVPLTQQPQGHGRVVGAQHLVVGEQVGSAEEGETFAREGEEIAVLTGETADFGVVLGAPVHPHGQAVEERIVAPGLAVLVGRHGPRLGGQPEGVDDERDRARRPPGSRRRGGRRADGWCSRRGGTSTSPPPSYRGRARCRRAARRRGRRPRRRPRRRARGPPRGRRPRRGCPGRAARWSAVGRPRAARRPRPRPLRRR